MKVLSGLLGSVALLAMSASAATITQTVSIGPLTTDVSFAQASGLFQFFGTAGAPGGSVLNSVTLEIVIHETLNSLGLTNNNTGSATAQYTAANGIDANDTASATDTNALEGTVPSADRASTFHTGLLIYQNVFTFSSGGQVITCPGDPQCTQVPVGSSVFDTGVITGTTSAYTGSGTFSLQFDTLSAFSIAGGGNNVNSSQNTTASATATVIYNYTAPSGVPEPATLAIFGSGLIALALAGRKKILGK